MIDSSAAAPPLRLQLFLQQQTKLTGINVVVGTKEALKLKKKKLVNQESNFKGVIYVTGSWSRTQASMLLASLQVLGGEDLFLDPREAKAKLRKS
jgi:hypothetical protein